MKQADHLATWLDTTIAAAEEGAFQPFWLMSIRNIGKCFEKHKKKKHQLLRILWVSPTSRHFLSSSVVISHQHTNLHPWSKNGHQASLDSLDFERFRHHRHHGWAECPVSGVADCRQEMSTSLQQLQGHDGSCICETVDSWNPAPVEVGSFSHYL